MLTPTASGCFFVIQAAVFGAIIEFA